MKLLLKHIKINIMKKYLSVLFFLSLLFATNVFFAGSKNSNAECYYKKKGNFIEIVKIKRNGTFEYLNFHLGYIDGESQYSQGKVIRSDSSIVFNSCFIDSVNYDVKEVATAIGKAVKEKYILVKCQKSDDFKYLCNIDFDALNDREWPDGLYIYIFSESGKTNRKKFDFSQHTFGKIYYDFLPVGFYLKVRDNIVSKIYTIKSKASDEFEIKLHLDKRYYIYDYKKNSLLSSNYIIKSPWLINPVTSDTFTIMTQQIEEDDDIQKAAYKYKQSLLKR